MDTLDTRKQILRKEALKRIQSLPPLMKKQASESICAYLLQYIETLSYPRPTLLGFIPLADEPNLYPCFQQLFSLFPEGIAFPKVSGPDLVFYFTHALPLSEIASDKAYSELPIHDVGAQTSYWETGAYGISEPSESLPCLGKDVAWGTSVLVLVPGRAFDTRGNRLGRGKGFYDRFLYFLRQQTVSVIALGVCFFCQLFHEIPQERGDESVNLVLTERGFV